MREQIFYFGPWHTLAVYKAGDSKGIKHFLELANLP